MSTVATPIFPATPADRQTSAIAELRRRVAALERGNGGITLADGSIAGGALAPGTGQAGFFGPGSVPGSVVIPGSLTVDRLLAGSITANYIAANTIVANLIAANTITAGQIAAGTITATQIAAGTITANEIAAGTITAAKIAADTITANEIAAGTITATEIHANTITANEIAAATLTSANIAAGTITATNIAAGAITSGLLASGAVTAGAIATGAVTSTKISVAQLDAVAGTMGTVTGGRFQTATSGARSVIGSGIVTSGGTYTGIVQTDASNNVTFLADAATGNVTIKGAILSGSSGLGNISGQINGNTNIVSATVTGDRLVIDTITAREIAASTVTSVEILANTITAGQIATGTITATQIAVGSLTGDRLSATAIDGKVITGAAIQTASSGRRVTVDTNQLRSFDASGNEVIQLGGPDAGIRFSAPSSDALDRQIGWFSGASRIARIAGYGDTGTLTFGFEGAASDPTVYLSAIGSVRTAQLNVASVSASQSTTGVFASTTNAGQRWVLNDLGQSSFLQLAPFGTQVKRQVAFGTGTLVYSNNNDASFTVAHGLYTTPSQVVASPRNSSSANALSAPSCSGRDTANITIQARTYNGGNITASISVDWMAIA